MAQPYYPNQQPQPTYAPAGGAPVWNSQPYAQQHGAPSGPPPSQFQPPQQQQYPPIQPGRNGNGKKEEYNAGNAGYEEPIRFKPKKKWNDLPFLIFFILTVSILRLPLRRKMLAVSQKHSDCRAGFGISVLTACFV
jgi:hypothetical protein